MENSQKAGKKDKSLRYQRREGDLSNCNNYNGITLFSGAVKVFKGIILERIKAATDGKKQDEQAGFRKNAPPRIRLQP